MSDSEQEWWQAERYRQYKEALDRRDEQIAMLREVLVPHIADLRATADTIASWREDRLKRTVAEIRKAAGELEAALAATAQPEQDGGWLPIESAPKDAPFLTYAPDLDDDREQGPYDIAYWSEESGEFVKFGCGLDGVTLWHPIIHPTSTEAEGEG